MKILHTSDWHLGRTLYSKKDRQAEHIAFFEWLIQAIKVHEIELVIVAGDVFDTTTPSSTSQKMYYDFLVEMRKSGCENVIIVGGNHDSPSFLNAPKIVLASLNVAVVGNASENLMDEIIIVNNKLNKPQIIVCGVPFLRERDISRFTEGENFSDRSKRINTSIKKHYDDIAQLAIKIRSELGLNIPIIATGHLSVAEGKRNEDDGVKETYVGNIEVVEGNVFPTIFDYVALGHYHIPSLITENIRYCGSPIPMGFGEAEQVKCVYVLDFKEKLEIKTIDIPVFQKLVSIAGNKVFIQERLNSLKNLDISVWVEINYNGNEIFPDLQRWLNEQTIDTKIEILKCINRQFQLVMSSQEDFVQSLESFTKQDVFEKILDTIEIDEEQKESLKIVYNEIVDEIENERE